jgi:hypothetical protein
VVSGDGAGPKPGRYALRIGNSVWFPLGFTLLYFILVFAIFSFEESHGQKGRLPTRTIAATMIATVSTLLVWVFYCLSFLLKLRHRAGILCLIGLFSPAVVVVTFALIGSLSNSLSQAR